MEDASGAPSNPALVGQPKSSSGAPPLAAASVLHHAPEVDDDDLDELDDMLDEFSPTEPGEHKQPQPSGPGRPSDVGDITAAVGGEVDDAFAKQLQNGMADLLGELETSPEMRAQFEELVRSMEQAATEAIPQPSTGRADSAPAGPSILQDSATGPEESFQETIRRTMQRMQESGHQATAAAAADDTDDILAEMLKQMQSGGFEGAGSEEDFSKMLLGMMEQLTNKDILYEPMKELNDKFPPWMDRNRKSVSSEDMKRYQEQQTLVAEIVGRFEQPGYADSNASDRKYIVERMQKMQAAGSPPADLVGDMNAAQEAFGDLEAGCPQQ